jgi:predicted MFS family arabinose efflux permease
MPELSCRTIKPSILLIDRRLTLVMALAAGLAVANIYYSQPMLGVIELSFPGSATIGFIPTATQLGYAVGLFLLVPLGDIRDRRRLIVVQFLILALAMLIAAIAPTANTLIGASVMLGASATVTQQIVPFAAALADPAQRGRIIGIVMGGLLCGILLSRTLAGFIAAHFGWRVMFWLAVPLALAGAGAMGWMLPRNHPHTAVRYAMALKSLAHLWRTESGLRTATLAQAALFGSFSVFWTVLAWHLQDNPFAMGTEAAGLFGIVGAIGVFAAPLAGRIADRRGPEFMVCVGAFLTMVSWLIFGMWNNLIGLIVGVILLDFGVQSTLVSNQHVIYALDPSARSRLNTIFMTGMFLGGAIGSAGATATWRHGGWFVVCGFGGALAAAALMTYHRRRRINKQTEAA